MPDSAIVLPIAYDFLPSAQKEDTSQTLDAYILSLAPYGYWKLNEASGAPQDSSGNAHHGAVGVAPSYSQAGITSKVATSMRFDGGRLTFPTPIVRLGALSGVWAMGGLFYIEAELGTSSPAATANGSPFAQQYGSSYATTSDFYVAIARQYGDIAVCRSGANAGGFPYVMVLNQPLAIFVRGTSVPGVTYSIELWINGVKMGECMRGAAGNGTTNQFQVGRSSDINAPFPKFKASNICFWGTAELTARQICNITQLMLDRAAYTTAWKP